MEHQEDITTAEENAEMDRIMSDGKKLGPVAEPHNTRGALSELPTRVLLAMKEDLQLGYADTTCWYRPETSTTSRIFRGNISQIRVELAKRPHVMNKVESKLMRKLQADNGMTEAQVRNVPKFKTMLAEASGNLIKVDKHTFELYQRRNPGDGLTGSRRLSVNK